ncbi:MAG: hypothetical protein F6K65_03540 [Moorea sp. SIO3C2]|nr:hypothetical protein [Moorena sp. SIO3C2]
METRNQQLRGNIPQVALQSTIAYVNRTLLSSLAYLFKPVRPRQKCLVSYSVVEDLLFVC